MSTVPAVTMQELELETAELLPSRETLCVWNPCHNPCQSYNPCQPYNPCHQYNPCGGFQVSVHPCW